MTKQRSNTNKTIYNALVVIKCLHEISLTSLLSACMMLIFHLSPKIASCL